MATLDDLRHLIGMRGQGGRGQDSARAVRANSTRNPCAMYGLSCDRLHLSLIKVRINSGESLVLDEKELPTAWLKGLYPLR